MKNLKFALLALSILTSLSSRSPAKIPIYRDRTPIRDSLNPSVKLALTPPMGWNSWNIFHSDINEQKIKEIADAMVSSGMRDAGYEYLVLDDAWMDSTRDENGRLQADPRKFPAGMKAIGNYIHSKGLKFGIYECRGYLTCQQLPGSFEHEEIDMQTFADWGVDYIKLDACFAEKNGRLTTEDLQIYKDAIDQTGRPMILSISDFGNGAWVWGGKKYGQLWRTSYDIYPWIENVYHHAETSGGDLRIHPAFNGLWQFAGPGHWNDPDMLEIGNLKSPEEDRIHMSLWCMLAAPLMAGNDVRNMSDTLISILTAPEVIAVNQDPRGHQGYKIFDNGKQQVYNKPLSDGTTAVLLLNKDTAPANVSVAWSEIGLSGKQRVRDLWAQKNLGKYRDGFTAWQLPQHGQYLIKVGKPGGDPLPGPAPVPPEKYTATANGFSYLSDLFYIMKYGQAPYYDENPEGDSIRIDNQAYGKGISTVNGTIMLYKMAGNSFRFRAMVGLDESYTGKGSGRFRVLEEDAFGGKVLFDSGKMTQDSAAKQIDIDVKGMDCIYLKFEGKEGAVGSWGHARLVGSWDSHPVTYETAYVDSLIREMELIPIQVTGPKDNRINIVIINRWMENDEAPYNSPAMREEFVNDVEKSLKAAFTPGDPRAQTAYANYHQFYNLYALWWPNTPAWRDGVETDLIDAVRDRMFLPWADEHHGWVTFLIMPNRDGGGGGAARNMETRTGNALIVGNAIGKMLHEISHTATSIGDEYAAAAKDTLARPTYTVTKNVDSETIKWRAWIDEETPVPTPYSRKYIDKIGAFEGAQYHLLNYYRPSAQGCIMGAGVFDNTEEMCAICEQRLSMRAYALVNPIENPSPAKSEFVIQQDTNLIFSVNRIKPEPDTQEISWLLNGKVIATGTDKINLDIKSGQAYELIYALRDTTSRIRQDPPYGEYPYREHRWRINPDIPMETDSYVHVWEDHQDDFAGHRYEAEKGLFDTMEASIIDFEAASELKYMQCVDAKEGYQWTVKIPTDGTYRLTWSYAARQRGATQCDLLVNGKLYFENFDFPETVPLFTGWTAREVNVELRAGENIIRLASEDKLPINLDYLWVPEEPNKELAKHQIALTESVPVKETKKYNYDPDQVKSAGLTLWLDASDIQEEKATPYNQWIEKVSGKNGPNILFRPHTLNDKGIADFAIVWLTALEQPVKEFQTIMMVYKESDMSFEGTCPFRDLDEYIGRGPHGSNQLFADDVSDLTRNGRVWINSELVDQNSTPTPDSYCLMTIELSKKVDKEFKFTQGLWEGAVAEMLIFNGKLSEKERAQLEKGLISKWALDSH